MSFEDQTLIIFRIAQGAWCHMYGCVSRNGHVVAWPKSARAREKRYRRVCLSELALGKASSGRRGGLESIGVDRGIDEVGDSLVVGGGVGGSRGILVLIHLLVLKVTVVILVLIVLLGGVLLGGLGKVNDFTAGAGVDNVVQRDDLALGVLVVLLLGCGRRRKQSVRL